MRWFRFWSHRQRSLKRSLKNTHIHWILGERIFHSHLWAMDKSALAGGLSLGLFVAFTPTIPFQMLLCTLGALILRVNLPIALAACWITNPITAVPIYLFARKMAKWLFAEIPLLLSALDLFGMEGRGRRFLEESVYLWTGGMLLGLPAAALGNILIRIIYNSIRRVSAGERRKRSNQGD